MNFVEMLARVVGRVTAVTLALASWQVTSLCYRDITRDRAYSERLRSRAASIEGVRMRLGHAPSEKELESLGGKSTTVYTRMVDWPAKLRSLGALADDDYMLAVMRSEEYCYYYSWSDKETCDSQAWILIPALALPLAVSSLLLLRLSRRRQRKDQG